MRSDGGCAVLAGCQREEVPPDCQLRSRVNRSSGTLNRSGFSGDSIL